MVWGEGEQNIRPRPLFPCHGKCIFEMRSTMRCDTRNANQRVSGPRVLGLFLGFHESCRQTACRARLRSALDSSNLPKPYFCLRALHEYVPPPAGGWTRGRGWTRGEGVSRRLCAQRCVLSHKSRTFLQMIAADACKIQDDCCSFQEILRDSCSFWEGSGGLVSIPRGF